MSATFTALTTLPGKQPAEALGDALERLDPEPHGIGVFEIEDGSGLWEVGAYFTDPPDEAALALLAAAFGAKPFAVSQLPETDWVAKVRRDLAPVRAGRFFVYGSHDADKVPDGVEPLLIDASMAFGTGHHGTTLGCLRALDRLASCPPAWPISAAAPPCWRWQRRGCSPRRSWPRTSTPSRSRWRRRTWPPTGLRGVSPASRPQASITPIWPPPRPMT